MGEGEGVWGVWKHSGDSRAPHVKLRSGLHSDGYIDILQFLSDVANLQDAAMALATEIDEIYEHRIDWVFGSPMAGISLATVVGPLVGARHVGFTEKASGVQQGLICRFEVDSGDRVLLVEEMTTTGGTPQRGIWAIGAKNPQAVILPHVGVFLTRCPSKPPELRDNAELVPVINLPELGVTLNEWSADKCPLCDDGSKVIENCKLVWRDLLQTMQDPTHVVPPRP